MTTKTFTNALADLLTGFTNPPRMSERKRDEQAERGCDAGNGVGREIHRIERMIPEKRSYPGEVFVRFKDGSAILATITYSPRRRIA